ncbi:DUF6002 family protein [Lentzea cavernae]|uniref:Uncharacterized protein n=1 Tax=Lentzea cavernae TaxID=2020703 RepID=A0ABQ3MH03_9PSEU|nr:DUF6002 family protein [Lentzea cavernae]GHH43344.1 hypothetical protein GCM10017774_41170 [Lentzea cavernae]
MSAAGKTIVSGVVPNALSRYFEEIQATARAVAAGRADQPVIPLVPVERFDAFTDVTDIGLTEVDDHTYLLDLIRNPAVRTTKTVASLLMISRAVSHIRRTGERVLLITPTSGNKGTALRDAVARAYATGIVTPDQLRIVMLAPRASRSKLRGSPLTADATLRTANPLVLAHVDRPADVKLISGEVVARLEQEVLDTTGFRVWYTLDLDNYRIADAVRAFAEAELLPITGDSPPRTHAHAVSSAFGLLGYGLGLRRLAERGTPVARHPGFFLVQQLATADMVTSLLNTKVPDYEFDAASGLWRQDAAPEFPLVTADPEEVIDSTFYTKAPVTSTEINAIVERHGGGGVVVSKRECLDRFDRVRALAARAGIEVAEPGLIREWSLVKALTGVLVARERGLIAPGTDVVVHVSGYYSDELIAPMRDDHVVAADTPDEFARVVLAAANA